LQADFGQDYIVVEEVDPGGLGDEILGQDKLRLCNSGRAVPFLDIARREYRCHNCKSSNRLHPSRGQHITTAESSAIRDCYSISRTTNSTNSWCGTVPHNVRGQPAASFRRTFFGAAVSNQPPFVVQHSTSKRSSLSVSTRQRCNKSIAVLFLLPYSALPPWMSTQCWRAHFLPVSQPLLSRAARCSN